MTPVILGEFLGNFSFVVFITFFFSGRRFIFQKKSFWEFFNFELYIRFRCDVLSNIFAKFNVNWPYCFYHNPIPYVAFRPPLTIVGKFAYNQGAIAFYLTFATGAVVKTRCYMNEKLIFNRWVIKHVFKPFAR